MPLSERGTEDAARHLARHCRAVVADAGRHRQRAAELRGVPAGLPARRLQHSAGRVLHAPGLALEQGCGDGKGVQDGKHQAPYRVHAGRGTETGPERNDLRDCEGRNGD